MILLFNAEAQRRRASQSASLPSPASPRRCVEGSARRQEGGPQIPRFADVAVAVDDPLAVRHLPSRRGPIAQAHRGVNGIRPGAGGDTSRLADGRIAFVVIPHQQVPNAAAVCGGVGVITGFLDRFPDDEVPAVAMGHELAHSTDCLGLHYAKVAGYDPAAALTLIDNLQTRVPSDSVQQFLDNHPPDPERRSLIGQELQTLHQSSAQACKFTCRAPVGSG
jgi:hypothetical protein